MKRIDRVFKTNTFNNTWWFYGTRKSSSCVSGSYKPTALDAQNRLPNVPFRPQLGHLNMPKACL